jgi:AcrR family transcriptional regulator
MGHTVEETVLSSAARKRSAILDATREMLVEGGVHGLTIEGVAVRAGVAKTTIYRRWRSKDELALAVLIDMVEQFVPEPAQDETRAEFVAFLDGAVKVLSGTLMGRVMQGIVSDLAADAELARAFRERVVGARLAEVRRLLERGVERGDLRPDADPESLHELLFGPVYFRLLLSGAPLDDGLAGRVVDAVLPSISRS